MSFRTWIEGVRDTVLDWQPSKQRQIDIDILWPSIRAQASNLEFAREAFYLHCMGDPAWKHIDTHKIRRITEQLT